MNATVGGSGNSSSIAQQQQQSGKFSKRQISRELFVVNQDGNSNQCDKSDNDNNNRVGSNCELNKGRTHTPSATAATSRSGTRRKFFPDSSTLSFGDVESPRFLNASIIDAAASSTPTLPLRMNRSIDEVSTPNSSFQFNNTTKSSFGGNSSRKSFDYSGNKNNNSISRRNTSSPLCLGDFMNTSGASSSGKQGGGGKRKNLSGNSKFSATDFPSLGQSVSTTTAAAAAAAAPPNDAKMQMQSKEKPKKRVMPITVSRKPTSNSSSFISSSFQSENNLLTVTALEVDESVFDVKPEREMLRERRDEITKVFGSEKKPIRNLHALIRENLQSSPASVSLGSPAHKSTALEYDDDRVERREMVMAMAKLYSFIIDMNHVPNILSEFSYLVNLLNTEHNPYEQQQQKLSSNDIASHLLKNFHNCIFFAACVLNHQKQTLSMLDCTTIRVLCDYERIQRLTTVLYEYLRSVVQKKMQMDTLAASKGIGGGRGNANSINKVVFYQQETDNRDNFPSEREFGAFKKQRDFFYSILRSWELQHLDPSWDFRKELGAKVRGLLTLLEHPINMAHLAKLFTAQLIISCNFDNELQMALPNIDLSKLSKLRQRLVAPSLFSTQYLFPGNQAFFRDFIICSDFHMMFMEQLKIALISELLQMNDSSMETLSIARGKNSNDDDDDDSKEKSFQQQEFIVRAETISTMRVIGKFIGFVASRSYSYDGYRNSLVDQKQISIRNLIHPDFDVRAIVMRALDGRKLLVTIPWLVEYLAMLDFITIRLDYYRELFRMLYTIYLRVTVVDGHNGLCIMPQSKFIIRTCLGWLFEHPAIPEDYYTFNMRAANVAFVENEDGEMNCCDGNDAELNSHLESLIHSACPFLADFRVAMMPQRITKAVSRTGRYRHITTKIQDKSSNVETKQDNHERLIEAFLASQSLSMRKIVDFTIDRVTSAVIKDFQVRHLLTIRKEARSVVEKSLTPCNNDDNLDMLKRKMREIFHLHLERLHKQWDEDVLVNCRKRVEGTFESLLPIETLNDVKKTLINIACEKTLVKLQYWRATNISLEIFSKDIHTEAVKLMESHQHQASNKRTSQNMIIDLSGEHQPSEYFQALQSLLQRASNNRCRHAASEICNRDEIIKLFDITMDVLNKQTLPSNAYRSVAFYLLQLMLLLIANRPKLITKEILASLFMIWHHEKLLPFTATKITDKDDEISQQSHNNRLRMSNFIFNNVISSRFMVMLVGRDEKSFEVYADFLVELIKANFITMEIVNELSIGLYQHEWNKVTLDKIAFLIQRVKSFLPSSQENADSHLFMELVADLAREMENL